MHKTHKRSISAFISFYGILLSTYVFLNCVSICPATCGLCHFSSPVGFPLCDRRIATGSRGSYAMRTPHSKTLGYSRRGYRALRTYFPASLHICVYVSVSLWPVLTVHAHSRATSRPLAPVHISCCDFGGVCQCCFAGLGTRSHTVEVKC